jgi:hypothetical protein
MQAALIVWAAAAHVDAHASGAQRVSVRTDGRNDSLQRGTPV